MYRTNKAITLITLIITIIVLLILAGVTINMVLGENGLFNIAKTSVAKYENAQVKENITLDEYRNEIDSYINGNRDVILTDEVKNYIDDRINGALTITDVTTNYPIAYDSTYVDGTKNNFVIIKKSGNTVMVTFEICTKKAISSMTGNIYLITGLPKPVNNIRFISDTGAGHKARGFLDTAGKCMIPCWDEQSFTSGETFCGTLTYLSND